METQRLETFSDGVFAIAITLLVLGIDVPPFNSALGAELLRLWPSYVAYLVSFLLIGAIWINHHAMFRHIVRADGTLLVLNLVQLLVFAFLPFPTAVLAGAFLHGRGERVATAFYGAALVIGGLSVVTVWQYAAHGHRLLSPGITVDEARQVGRRYFIGPLGYLAATLIGLLLPWLAFVLFVFLNAFFLWPGGIDSVVRAGGSGRDERLAYGKHRDLEASKISVRRLGTRLRRRG